jgi:tellurite resistance protein
MGLFGLGLAWRQGAGTFAIPRAIGETILGAVTLLFLFALLAYTVKLLRRPSVLTEDLRVLPGRAGVAAMVLCIYLLSITLAPYAAVLAQAVLWAGFAVHGVFVLVLVRDLRNGPAEQRRVMPVWHLSFVGPIIGGLAATVFELYLVALVLLFVTVLLAALVWAASAEQMLKETVPAPLRPLLAIHLAPLALFGLVAHALELDAVALGCAGIAALAVLWFLVRARWLTEAGFSALWGAFTFPIAATANLWLSVGGIWRVPGGVALVAATLVILPIGWKVIALWARGQLAIRTNAATA